MEDSTALIQLQGLVPFPSTWGATVWMDRWMATHAPGATIAMRGVRLHRRHLARSSGPPIHPTHADL